MAAGFIEAGVLLLVALTAGLTLFVTFLIWRDGYLRGWRTARNTPPRCLACGYNLSGLTHCRCPECGAEFSIDALWRACLFPRRSARKGDADSGADTGGAGDGTSSPAR